MRKIEIEVLNVVGGYRINCAVMECDENGDTTTLKDYSHNTAVCSTYSQIPTRIKSLVDVAKEHMQPAKEEADTN